MNIENLKRMIDDAFNREEGRMNRSRQMGRTADTIVFDEAQMKLPFWKRFRLWVWRKCHRRHISIWVSNDKEKKKIEKATKRIQDQLIVELARKAMNMEEK